MQLILETINFDTGAIQLLIEGVVEPNDRSTVIDYVNNCQRIGINKVTLRYQSFIPPESLQIIESIAAFTGAIITAIDQAGNNTDLSNNITRFEFRSKGGPEYHEEHNTEYLFNFSKSEETLDTINSAINYIGKAMNLDERTSSRLKLCVYELTVNSVEHGTFETDDPTITLVISSNKTHVTICYKDNANIFLTKGHQAIDIGNKIKTKSTRGLGLFIMNRLSQNFEYKRLGNWNVTTFKINKQCAGFLNDPGRSKMNSFSIKLVTCDIENAMIIQPIGAIDSSTTQNMEEQFMGLLKDHKQYIIVDFSQVTFLSSSGIGILLGTVSSLREKGGDLIFMKVPTQIREIFDVLNIADYFITVNSVEELAGTIHV